jgi:3D (Asp-Asp-Asp) domain-containing protein
MSLTKPKFTGTKSGILAKLIIILAFLSQIVNPSVVNAQSTGFFARFSQKAEASAVPDSGDQAVLKRSAESRLFFPNVDDDQPDRTVRAVITAYTSTVDQCDDDPFIAASGKHVYDGMIAANWLPFGAKIKIPSLYGDKIFTVDDRMNSRYGFGRMDIWFDASKSEARKFGVKRVDVEVYYPEQKVAKAK